MSLAPRSYIFLCVKGKLEETHEVNLCEKHVKSNLPFFLYHYCRRAILIVLFGKLEKDDKMFLNPFNFASWFTSQIPQLFAFVAIKSMAEMYMIVKANGRLDWSFYILGIFLKNQYNFFIYFFNFFFFVKV